MNIKTVAYRYGKLFDNTLLHYGGVLLHKPQSVFYLESKKKLKKSQKKIKNNPKAYPFETAEEVYISDTKGLEHILSRTEEGGEQEWATVIKSSVKDHRIKVHYILNSEKAEEKGYIHRDERRPQEVRYHNNILDYGYNGTHHYHSELIEQGIFGEANFFVNSHDRVSLPANTINLLSFLTQDGPEVIAYNRLHTYISLDEDKQVLRKVTHKEILKHLS